MKSNIGEVVSLITIWQNDKIPVVQNSTLYVQTFLLHNLRVHIVSLWPEEFFFVRSNPNFPQQ